MSKFVKSIDVNKTQSENIFDISATILVLNEPWRFTDVKDVQLENIYLILITFDVSKSDNSKFLIIEQDSNIYSISLTFETSKLDKSIVVKDLQPPNKWLIFVALLVLNFEKSIEVKL